LKTLTQRWITIEVSQDPEQWIHDILRADTSVLLIPPRLNKDDVDVPEPPTQGVYVGLFSSGTLSDHPNVHWILREKLLLNAKMSAQAFQIHADDRLLILASPWHVAGLSWRLMGLQLGAHTELYTPYQAALPQYADRLSRFSYTHVLTTPLILRTLMALATWQVEVIICGGAPFDKSDFNLLPGHCASLINAYGQTECGGLISLKRLASDQWIREDQTQCVGHPPEAIRIRCMGTQDSPGPIYVQSPTAIIEGWTDTGDHGYLDDKGDLFIFKRKKDGIFTTGGK